MFTFLPDTTFGRSTLVDLKNKASTMVKLLLHLKSLNINRDVNSMAHDITKFCYDSRADGTLVDGLLYCVHWLC